MSAPVAYNVANTPIAGSWFKAWSFPVVGGFEYGVVSVNIANHAVAANEINIAVGVIPAAPLLKDVIEYKQILPVSGVIHKANIIVQPGESIWIKTQLTTASVRIDGILFDNTLSFPKITSALVTDANVNNILTVPDASTVVFGTFNINIVNTATADGKLQLLVNDGQLENAKVLVPNQSFENNCNILSPDDIVKLDADVFNGDPISFTIRVAGVLKKPAA